MISLWLCLLATVSLTFASPNVTGTWLLDWQNMYMNSTKYGNLTITETNDATQNLSAFFGISPNSVINLTFVSTNVWADGSGQQLTYDPTTDTVTYNISYAFTLFSRTGSFVSRQDVFGSLSGLWINPTPVNDSTTLSKCCAPTSMYFLINPMESPPDELSVILLASTTNCSSPVPLGIGSLNFGDPSTQTLVWQDEMAVFFRTRFQLSLSPSNSLNQVQIMLNNTATCEFYYYRSNQTQLLDNTWQQDWQTTANVEIESYKVFPINSSNVTYMMSEPTLKNGSVIQGYVAEGPDSVYEDSAPISSNYFLYTYDSQTDTLLGNGSSFLMSPNGSLLSSAPFIKSWYTLDNSSYPNCCLPYLLTISGQENTSTVDITYYFPENYGSNDECANLFVDTSIDTFPSNISTVTPNITQLVWTDNVYSTQISFTNASTTSELVVSNFDNQAQCTFKMSDQNPNPSPPSPLAAGILSTRMIVFVLGIFIMLMY